MVPGRLEAYEALEVLMTGGWAVRAHSDGPGTRTLVAVRGPGLPYRSALTAREMRAAARRARGVPLKVLASELDRSAACAAACIASAIRKLKLRSLSDLAAFFGAWPDHVVAHAQPSGDDECIVLTYEVPSWSLPPCLSAAERRVVQELLAGGSHTTVARACGIAPRTVANHVASVHRKLNVHSRAELVGTLCHRQAAG